MSHTDLDKELKAIIDGFASDVKSEFPADKSPVTHEELLSLARFTFYALDSVRESILKYIAESDS